MGGDDHHNDDEPSPQGEADASDEVSNDEIIVEQADADQSGGEGDDLTDRNAGETNADIVDDEPETSSEISSEIEAETVSESELEPASASTFETPVEKKPRRWTRVIYWFAVAAVWLGIGLGAFAIYLAADLPDLDALQPPGVNDRVEIRANDGSLLVTYGAVHDKNLTSSEIPMVMKQAIIAIEDRRFFEHSGIDARSILRAVWTNVSMGRLRQGGSTLTQQLAKNIFLSQERTIKRKVQELLLAFWLEQKFSKDAILTLYLNRVYFGSGTYGIEAASQKYYGHTAKNLSIGEAALLAGLVKAPSRLSPLRNKEASYTRSHIVLGTMEGEGFISAGEVEFGRQNPPIISTRQIGGDNRYFGNWILEQLPQYVEMRSEPLVVYTSLDPIIQRRAVQALKDGLAGGAAEQANIGQGALLALSFEGSVQAMVGGVSYADSQFNRSTQALRQPGSSFKPFVFLAAIEQGMPMNRFMVDEPLDIDGWTPNNFSGQFLGRMSVHEAFVRSINTVAVQVSEWAGRQNVIDVARRLGIKTPLRPHPSIALGTFEVRMLEMVTAYSHFANGGYGVSPYGILEVRSASGGLLYRKQQVQPQRVINEEDLSKLRPLLEDVVALGTGRAARVNGISGAKTGTSQNYRDAWFIGYNRDLTAAVWLGNDDNTPMLRVTGGGLPARIWRQFMETSTSDRVTGNEDSSAD